jgi:hypothetical protein
MDQIFTIKLSMEATLSEFEIMRFKGSGEKNTINFLQQKEIFQIRMHAMPCFMDSHTNIGH